MLQNLKKDGTSGIFHTVKHRYTNVEQDDLQATGMRVMTLTCVLCIDLDLPEVPSYLPSSKQTFQDQDQIFFQI